VDLCAELSTGLESLLGVGYAIDSYGWVDIDPDAHTVVSRRITHLRLQFPHLLPSEAITDWNSRLPMDVRTISQELLRATFPEVIDLLLASPPILASHLPKTHKERTPKGLDVV
jgi:hypothetical protein